MADTFSFEDAQAPAQAQGKGDESFSFEDAQVIAQPQGPQAKPKEQPGMLTPAPGTTPGTFDYYKGLGREEMLNNSLLANLGAWAVKKVTGQKTEGTFKLAGDLAPKEQSTGELVKAGIKEMGENPVGAAGELAKGLFYQPEVTGAAILAAPFVGPEAAALRVGLAQAGKAARVAAMTGIGAAEGGAAMAGVNLVQQAAQKEHVSGAEVGAAAVTGALMVPALSAVHGLLGARKGMKETPTLDRLAAEVDHQTTTIGEDGSLHEAPARQPVMGKSDATINAERTANDLMQRGASIKEVERAVKNNPLVGKEMEAIRERRRLATEGMKEVRQGEVLPPEDAVPEGQKALPDVQAREAQGTPSPATAVQRADWRQRGEADPRMLAMVGLTAAGALGGAYLAGDEKIAGAVLGGIAGAGLLRLPSTLGALGKTLSPKIAAGTAVRLAGAMGLGTYLGAQHDAPVEGAAIMAAVLLGGSKLKPANKLTTDDMMRARNGNVAAQARITHNLKRDINTAVPDPVRRSAISEALDRGDPSLLQGNEVKVYKAVRQEFDTLGKEAVDAGVLRGMRENYISYMVERDPSMTEAQQASVIDKLFKTGAFSDTLSPNTKFAKHGKYDSFSELNNALKDSGLKLKTMDVGEIMSTYSQSMRRAIEDRILVDNLKAAKSPEGVPYIVAADKNGNLPRGYETIKHPQLQGQGIHPDLYDAARVMFESNKPDVVTKGLLALSQAVKRSQISASLFHAKSLAEVYINAGANLLRPKRAMDAALKKVHEGGRGDDMDLLIRHGMKLALPDDVSATVMLDLGAAADRVVPMQLGTKAATAFEAVNRPLHQFTWEYMHTGVKALVGLKELETLTLNNAKLHARDPVKFPLKTREQIAREVATYSNNLAGGVDWFGAAADAKTQLGRNLGMFFAGASGRRMAQIIAFAPDWALSTMKAGMGAFGRSETGLRGLITPNNEVDLYRRYAMRSALTWLTLINGINMATSGHPIWRNRDPTRIELEDGTTVQPAKHTMEVVHAATDPVRFAYNKLGYAPKMLMDLGSGREGYGAKAPAYDSFVGHAAKSALPFVSGPLAQPNLSAGERVTRAMSSGLGAPRLGYNKEQKEAGKQDRREKKLLKKRKQLGLEE